MARTMKKFVAFGVTYRTTKLSTVEGLELLDLTGIVSPLDTLRATEVLVDGAWVQLDWEGVNSHVRDAAGAIAPLAVLRALCSLVTEFNFEFLDSWKGVRVPTRFLSDSRTVKSAYSAPLVAQLVSSDAATLRELEEYYSLEDGFKMFDIMVAKGVNDAIANEDLQKER